MQYRIIKYDQFAKLNFCEKFNDFFFVDLWTPLENFSVN